MNDSNDAQLIVRPSHEVQIHEFEESLLTFLQSLDLPTDSILISIYERGKVLKNVEDALELLGSEKRHKSMYISKFIAAVSSGLFDAALNYLWNETIAEIRQRVANYDLSYFVDNAVSNQDRRKSFTTEKDLEKMDDNELIHGAREIELLSDIGFRHLNFIRDMRNHASAAHPNQNEITGYLLVSWLEVCIKEVISLPEPMMVTKIKSLLTRIKTNNIDEIAAEQIATTFERLSLEQVTSLASGFFGIYTRPDTTTQTRENIHRLAPYLWPFVDEATRQQFGVKYGQFIVNGDENEAKLARQFLEVVSAISYIPNDLRAVDIKNAIESLLNAHRGLNNFHNEPPFARKLQRIVGEVGTIPPQVNKPYVLGLVEVFLTNGHGVAYKSEDIYLSLINLFDSKQALIAITSFTDANIASKLQFPTCKSKYYQLLEMMKIKISSSAVKDLIQDIEAYKGPLYNAKDVFKKNIANLQKLR